VTLDLREVAAARTEAVRQALRRELKLSPLKQGQVSRQLGMGEGYLANFFTTLQGRKPIAVRLDLVLALLALLGVRPSRFFAEIEQREGWFGEATDTPAPTQLRSPIAQEVPSPLDPSEIGRCVLVLLEAIQSRAARAAKKRRRRKSGDSHLLTTG
jgi:hypothetical protein